METQEPAVVRQRPAGVFARARSREISARRFFQLAVVTVCSLWIVVMSGAVVRLTASGLGCDNWPRCGDKPYPEKWGHAAIEFGNRMVALVGIVLALLTWLAARRVVAYPGSCARSRSDRGRNRRPDSPRRLTVSSISPGRGDVALPTGARRARRRDHRRARGVEPCARARPPAGPAWLRTVAAVGVAACAALVVTGTVATASGPHSGGRGHSPARARHHGHRVRPRARDRRLRDRLLIVGIFFWRSARGYPGIARAALVLFARPRDADGRRRGPVPQRPAMVAGRDPRLARGDDLGVDGGDRVLRCAGLPRRL